MEVGYSRAIVRAGIGAMEDDANALHVDDDPYFDAALDDASVHLDADILAYLIQHPEGEA